MRTLTRNEWIGVAVGILVVLYFLLGSLIGGAINKEDNGETMNEDQQNVQADAPGTASSSATNVGEGEGPAAAPGSIVTVHYVGTLENGQVFDSSRERGAPFSFVIGRGQVIQGWDEGLMGAKAGERKKLVIPPAGAYGQVVGHPLQNETLIFEIEILGVSS